MSREIVVTRYTGIDTGFYSYTYNQAGNQPVNNNLQHVFAEKEIDKKYLTLSIFGQNKVNIDKLTKHNMF